MDFAGISQKESYAGSLPDDAGGVPSKWPDDCYVENLVKVSEKREKKRLAEREKVEFVPAVSKSGASSASGTPKSSASGGRHRKSKFDQQ